MFLQVVKEKDLKICACPFTWTSDKESHQGQMLNKHNTVGRNLIQNHRPLLARPSSFILTQLAVRLVFLYFCTARWAPILQFAATTCVTMLGHGERKDILLPVEDHD